MVLLGVNIDHVATVRPNRLFTADRALILGVVGRIKPEAIRTVIDAVVRILEAQ